jgi:hypothetical protein
VAVFLGANNIVFSRIYDLTTAKVGDEFSASSREKKPVLREGAGRDECGIFKTGDRVTCERWCAAGTGGVPPRGAQVIRHDFGPKMAVWGNR